MLEGHRNGRPRQLEKFELNKSVANFWLLRWTWMSRQGFAKNVFQLHGVNQYGQCVLRKRISRDKLMEFIATLPICKIVMEACSGTYYWARQFQKYQHDVRLISPQ